VGDDAGWDRQALQGQLLTIVEQEKLRIGQDLHDDIGQELTGLGLTAETLFEALEDYSLPEADLAARLAKGVRRTLRKVRRVSQGLMPVEVDAGGLTAALVELTAQLELADGIRCTFDCRGPVTVSDGQVATQLYRIAQEATANAVRHARARRIDVSLDSQAGFVTLAIRDDGIGIDASGCRHGNGLQIMRHRAGMIGATLSIGPIAAGGTNVSCRLSEGGRPAGREP
ncbi:MAG: sensor histidine kinase, partial [Planctomycetaceae bacterium]